MGKLNVYGRKNDGRIEWVAYFRHMGRAIDLASCPTLAGLRNYADDNGYAGVKVTTTPY